MHLFKPRRYGTRHTRYHRSPTSVGYTTPTDMPVRYTSASQYHDVKVQTFEFDSKPHIKTEPTSSPVEKDVYSKSDFVFCIDCGLKLNSIYKFCPHCGQDNVTLT